MMNLSVESRDRESVEIKKASDFVLALLKEKGVPQSIEEITDAFEIKCEKEGMSRKERRLATQTFDTYRRVAVLFLADRGVIKRDSESKVALITKGR